MAYVGTIKCFGSEYKVPMKYMVPFMAIVVPALVVILGYMAYLVLESVDYYLGTTKVGAAVLLIVLLGKLTLRNDFEGERLITLLPEWANQAVMHSLPVLTLWSLYQQGRHFDAIFVLCILGSAVVNMSVKRIRAHRARAKEEEERRLKRGLTLLCSDPTYVKFNEDKK
jgi:hypothetical protein